MKRAVVLLSGGLDSATVLAYAVSKGYECHAISFDYGQRHKFELRAAKKVAKSLGAAGHKIVKVELNKFGGSALTANIKVPKSRKAADIGRGIPVTYVPARNTVFLSLALAYAETIGANEIFIGVNALDYSGYPDCRPEFIRAFEKAANLGTKAGVKGARFKIRAPLIKMTKAEIIALGLKLGVDYSLTHSCYDPAPDGTPCGRCDSCLLREKGFKEVFREAVSVLKAGGLVAYPTESFYGLAADALNPKAIERVFKAKARPAANPLPVIIHNKALIHKYVRDLNAEAKTAVEKLMPGPVTLVFWASDRLPDALTGGTGKVGIRVPSGSPALELARLFGGPITATSANISGAPPLTDPSDVAHALAGSIDLILDGGATPGPPPSTVLDVTVSPPALIREGAVKKAMIERLLGRDLS